MTLKYPIIFLFNLVLHVSSEEKIERPEKYKLDVKFCYFL